MLLSLVTENLAARTNLHVVQIEAWEELDTLAAGCTPDVLIYDLAATCDSNILPLLFKNPRLLLVGLDVENNRAVLLAGKETRSLTMERMFDIITTY